MKKMFEQYRNRPDLFPQKYQQRANRIGLDQMAIEYIAGMTDRFCEDQYRHIAGEDREL